MASTFTTNLNLELQGTGDNSGTWGTVLNSNALAIVDQALGGVQTLSLAAGDVTVNTSQSQNNAFILTGTIPANRSVTWPAIGRTIFVQNNTSGAFTVTLKAGAGSTTVTIPQGGAGYYTLNVNAVYAANQPGVPIGTVIDYAGSTAPSQWLLCYGQAISRTTYAALFSAIGTTYGIGDGSTTFNLPDARGRVGAGKDNMGGVSAGRITSAASGFDGNTLGAAGGSQTHTLVTAELAAHGHAVGTYQMPNHGHPFVYSTVNDFDGGATGGWVIETTGITSYAANTDAASSSPGKQIGGSGAIAITGSSADTGSGTAHRNVQPTIIFNKMIYAGV